jgi:nitrate/TMAO reductase-like tetraheme cytochrome c subunit
MSKPIKEKRFFNKVRGFKRFLLFTGIYLFVFLILLSTAAEYTSRPSFCPTCHYMETFYQSWRTSAHNKVDCVECHFEPGLAGTIKGKLNGLVQIVNYISLSYKKRKPWAEIPDNTCARSGCHERQAFQDTTYNFKGVMFNHKHHLQELRRGKTLKCISCHSQIVQGTHIEVTSSTCFNCHFMKSPDPEHNSDKLTNCLTCHDWSNKTKEEMASFRYDHTNVVQNQIPCNSCHSNVIQGTGEVGKERCFQCHFETERLEKYEDVSFMHTTHITKHSMKCFSCHSSIQHKIQKIDPSAPPDCISCHSNSHSSQVSLYTGENGYNTEKSPSSMYLIGINCKGCHIFHETTNKDVLFTKSKGQACENCHGKGYSKLVDQWKLASENRLKVIYGIYNTAKNVVNKSKSEKKSEAEQLISQAYHNIRIVEIGKSVHNIQFADKLLVAAYKLMQQALVNIGSVVKLPEFKSDSEFIPNECYNCHAGIQEINVKKFDMNFSHNLHIVKEKIICNKCHSNQNKHGELIINRDNCNNCHHSQSKTNEACAKCHPFQNKIYSGDYFGKNQPDIMKQGGVGCFDCHVASDKVRKPDKKICLKCHDKGYDEQMILWKNDISKLTSEIITLINQLSQQQLSSEQKDVLNEVRKVVTQINAYPSIYVHNYDLISTVLNEQKKKIKSIK